MLRQDSTRPADAHSGDVGVFMCRCGAEYVAAAPTEGPCLMCSWEYQIDQVRAELPEVEYYKPVEASSFQELVLLMNLHAAAGYGVIKTDPPTHCRDCGIGMTIGYTALMINTSYDRDAHAALLHKGDALQAQIEAAHLNIAEALRAAEAP